MSQLRFGVLGPLEVVGPDGPIDLGAPKHRALLGILVLTPGRVVSVDRLVDGLWHGSPPASATTTLQAYVSHLRRALEPERAAGAAASVLVTRPPGYLLDIADDQVDSRRFERLLREAEAAAAASRIHQASELVTEALGLFRGQPFADFAFDEWAVGEAARLAELQLAAQEQLLELELRRGRHAAVIGDAERLAKEHPTRERVRELLMLALYRSGRQADALRAYQEARDVLVEELGIDPGPGLRALEDRILAQDPDLEWQPEEAGEPVVATPAASVDAPPAGAEAPEAARVGTGSVVALGGAPGHGGFVGRGVERARLLGLVDAARTGTLRVALVSGEPGIGKTRLCEELAATGRAQGAVVVWARGYEGDGAPAFWPWVQVLRVLAEDLPADVLAAAVDRQAADIARVVPEYARFADAADDAELDGESARFRFFDAVATFLRRLSAHHVLVVVLDDLHWADQSSLRLLEFCLSALRDVPVAFVGTYRDSEARQPPLAATLATLAREPGLERVALRGLSVGEVSDYITTVVGEIPDQALVESVHDRTGGNPFFVAEIVRLLRTEGRLGVGSADAPIPEGVRDVIRTRLGRLPEDAVPVLTAAAVIGREFDVELVAQVCALDDDRVLDLIEAAWMIGIVDEARDGSGHFTFAHELVRETLCDDLPTLRRVRLHRAIGDAIERLHGERHPDHLAACAHHYAEAAPSGDRLKAVLYGQKAGDHLTAQLAYEDAIPIYERAIGLVDTYDVGSPQTRIDLLIGLGWALRASGRQSEARDVLRRAADRAEQAGDAVRLGRAVLGFGGGTFWDWWQEFGVSDTDLIQQLEHALELLEPGDSVLRCELLSRLAVELYFHCPRERRDALTREAVDMARRLDDPAALAAALAGRHTALWSPTNHDERLALSTELVEVAQAGGLRHFEVVGRHFRMIDRLECADRAGVEADFAVCEELIANLGQHALSVQLMWFRVMRATLDGRHEEAERLAHEAFEAHRATSEPAAWMALGAVLFQLRREQGRHGELEPLLRQAIERQPHVSMSWRIALALLLAEHGRPDEAYELVDDVLQPGLPGLPGGMLAGITLLQLAEVCIQGRFVEGAALLEDAVRDYPVDVVLLGTGHLCFGPIEIARGNLAWVLGRRDEAIEHLRKAIGTAERLDSAAVVARTRARLAVLLAERGGPGDLDEARTYADQAVADATAIGLPLVAAEARSTTPAP
ncbi:MAG TPA: BTAD domain-containing putative transcriptional regulator [Acidimicrobiia bacterium]|nr:BTAD domain-containing putative transcriptional regulator [Acidimicrobiia bacterium]